MISTISFYCRYERLGASSRIRFMQFYPKLRSEFTFISSSLLSDEYVKNLYNNKKQNYFKIFRAYLCRFGQVLFDKSDILIIEKELFPNLPWWIERLCIGSKKYIIDIDDAVFYNYEQSTSVIKRLLLAEKFTQLFKNSAAVLGGSPYLIEIAKSAGAKKVIYYPTVIRWDNYVRVTAPVDTDTVVIGWIGSGSTDKYLDLIVSPLAQVARQTNLSLSLHLIGSNRKISIPGVSVKNIEWSEDSEINSIHALDIGIMPLTDTPWEKAKCAYKLIQYMACGKPVIASDIGANKVVVDHLLNGYLCDSALAWEKALLALIQQPLLRNRMGESGRRKVQQLYTVDSNLRIFKQLIRDID